MRRILVLEFMTLDGVIGTIPASFKVVTSKISPSGVVIAYYKRAGRVKTGSF